MLSKQLTGSHSVFLVSFDISASSVCPRVILDLMVTETRHLKIFVIGIRYQVRATRLSRKPTCTQPHTDI